MLSWILLILVLLALIILGTWFFGRIFGRGEVLAPLDEDGSIIEDNRRAVGERRLGDVRFELVPRGYRPEQVDDVISHLKWKLEQAEATNAKQKSLN